MFTEEQKKEMHGVQVQIKRRVGIKTSVSERKLTDELRLIGLDESLIKRALLHLVNSGEFEYKKERRQVYRRE